MKATSQSGGGMTSRRVAAILAAACVQGGTAGAAPRETTLNNDPPPAPVAVAERPLTVACYYFPNVTMGWDSSPRAHQDDPFDASGYPFMNTISGNTPERFEKALELTKQRLLAQPDSAGPRILNINCWNEWTEGSYLEPDTVHGMRYLEAERSVFGKAVR